MRMILLGPPGSGKGTLAEVLCERYPFIHVSTGSIFRRHMAANDELGRQIASYMESGELVPDELTLRVVEDVLQDPDVLEHFLMDGFPRTLKQGQLFDELLHGMGIPLDVILKVCVPDEVIQRRLVGRRVCKHCGATYHIDSHPPREPGRCDVCHQEIVQRQDDQPKIIARRLENYHRLTAPLQAFYQASGKIVEINNDRPLEVVLADLHEKLGLDKYESSHLSQD